MKKWEVLESQYLSKGGYAKVRRERCKTQDGHVLENIIVNEYPDWVNVMAITPDKQVLMLKQYRHAADGFFLEFAAGCVEKGEKPENAALRELKEETGYAPGGEIVHLGSFYTNPALNTNRIHAYLAEDVIKVSEQNLDAGENIDVTLVPFNEVPSMIVKGDISHSHTIMVFALAKQYLSQKAKETP